MALAMAWGAETAKEEREPFVMLIQPKLLAGDLSRAIPGAQRTVLVPGREIEFGGLEPYDRKGFEKLGLGWEEFQARARASADRMMASLEPEYVRDDRRVIRYAVLRSKNPRTAGVILGAKFLETFRETLGNEVVALVPDRHTVFVFPGVAGGYEDYAGAIIEKYEDAVYPVSLEVFLVGGQGVRVVGTFSRR